MTPKVSIIIPCQNEGKYISGVIDDINKQTYPKEKLEVIFVDGASIDRTPEIIRDYCRDDERFILLENPHKIVPIALNMGIRAATGEYVIILGAHASYGEEYVSRLIYWANECSADLVGGVCISRTKIQTPTAIAIAKVFSDPLGVGNSRFRIGISNAMEVDTVPFGCYRKDVFERIGFFDKRLVRVQDYELHQRLKRAGGKIFLVPDISCSYYPRETYKALWKNRFSTGKWIVLVPYFINSFASTSFRHLVPLSFILSLFVPLFFSPLGFFFPCISLSSLILYISTVILRSIAITSSKTSVFHVIFAFFVFHISYGIGSLAGILDISKRILTGRSRTHHLQNETP